MVVPVLHISGFQKLPEQTNEMLVRNPLAQNGNQHMMVYIVKTALYVALNKPLCPREIFLHIFERRMELLFMRKPWEWLLKVGS